MRTPRFGSSTKAAAARAGPRPGIGQGCCGRQPGRSGRRGLRLAPSRPSRVPRRPNIRAGRSIPAFDGGRSRGRRLIPLSREPDPRRVRYPRGRNGRTPMLRVLGWIIGIIFLIGLLVVIGVFDLIF